MTPTPVPELLTLPNGPAGLMRAPTPEQERHRRQVAGRSRRRRRRLFGYAALCFSRSIEAPSFAAGGLVELGSSTAFVLSRHWGRGRHGRAQEVLLLRGYKAGLDPDTGAVALGGPGRCVCAYDLNYTPYADAAWGGKILSARKTHTLTIGLDLDAAIEAAVAGPAGAPLARPELPAYWLGFAADRPPAFEDTPAARWAALRAVQPGYDGPLLSCLRSPGVRSRTWSGPTTGCTSCSTTPAWRPCPAAPCCTRGCGSACR